MIETGKTCINRKWCKMYRIITNNRLCVEKYGDQIPMEYLETGTFMDVLRKTRDYLHTGWRLETHPLTGSIKPNQTPYKSIMVSDQEVERDEYYTQSMTIENAIASCEKFLAIRQTPDWPENIRADFRLVDLSLIEGAIQKILYY